MYLFLSFWLYAIGNKIIIYPKGSIYVPTFTLLSGFLYKDNEHLGAKKFISISKSLLKPYLLFFYYLYF